LAILTIESIVANDYLVWKFPKREISIGSQVIVNESEEALLYENGQLLHVLSAGRHLIESGNIPGLDGIIRRSIGNNSPLKIDIWFVNKTISSDYKWGVQLRVKDTTHQLVVPVGSYGSMLIKIIDPASIVMQVVGKELLMKKSDLKEFLLPSIERSLKDYIAERIKNGKLDIFNIDSILVEASEYTKESLTKNIEKFGLQLSDFYIQGIEVIGDNPEYLKLKEALTDAASLRIRAKAASESAGFYQQERALNAIDKAVAKDSNLATKLISKSFSENDSERDKSLDSSTRTELKNKLLELQELFNSDLISENEYNKKKKDLLSKI
tara:strand:- start:2144 stop:3118 length:975 start_codon:yes stop_codon:yes gene_type:complete